MIYLTEISLATTAIPITKYKKKNYDIFSGILVAGEAIQTDIAKYAGGKGGLDKSNNHKTKVVQVEK